MQRVASPCPGSAGGFALAICAAVLWSFIGPFSKKILEFGVAPLETAYWRALLGGICFFAQAAFSRTLFIPVRHAAVFFVFGWVGVGLLFGSLQVAIQLSGAATAMVLMYTAPIWVALASRFFFHEQISVQKIFVIFTALAGTFLICLSGGSIASEYSVWGISCGLVSGIAYASHFPFFSWWGKYYSVETIYMYMLFGGAVSLFPFVSFAPDKTSITWGWLLALAFLTTYIAYIVFAEGLKRISQIHAAVIGNIEPLLATLWVWGFFDENFSSAGWLGCVLIVGAVFVLAVRRNNA